MFRPGIAAVWSLTLHSKARNPVGSFRFGRCAVAKDINIAIGSIARMKRETVNQAIADREECLHLIGKRIIAQSEDSRGSVRLPALLDDQQSVGPRLRGDED